MFCRGLEIKCSWKVDKEVKSRLDCSVTKQERSSGKVERSDNAGGSVADAGGRDQAEDKDRSTYKYVLIEGCSDHLGNVLCLATD